MTEVAPSTWVRRFAPLIRRGGRVLDLACGSGRHSRLLASMGYHVQAVDRDPEAVSTLSGAQSITTQVADLEQGDWPFAQASFDGIVVTNYLHRPRFHLLLRALKSEGVLIYETFMVGNEKLGKPSSPEFLLQRDELLHGVRSELTVVAFEQGRIELPKPAVVQRICAVRGEIGPLPA